MKYIIPFLVLLLVFSCRTTTPVKEKHTTLSEYFRYSSEKKTMISAHRGGKGYTGYPENCLETMAYILTKIPNAIFEIDVAKTSDGVFVLMHDDALERTTTGSGRIERTPLSDVTALKLQDNEGNKTEFEVPTFDSVLKWATKHNAVLMVDTKKSVDPLEVLDAVVDAKALDQSVMITYSVKQAMALHKHNPDVMLSVSIRNEEEWERMQATGIPFSRMVAFTGTRASSPDLYAQLHQKGIMCILGTLGNLDKKAAARGEQVYRDFRKDGVDIFATDRPLEAEAALK